MDGARVETMFRRFAGIVNAHYKAGPADRDRVFEVLNALACTTAFVLAQIEDNEAQEFFNDALEHQIDAALEAKARGEIVQ